LTKEALRREMPGGRSPDVSQIGQQDRTGLATELYQHGMVNGLFKGDYNVKEKSNLPSYIPSRNFALAIMSIVVSNDLAGNI
jgi:hypothetical protein